MSTLTFATSVRLLPASDALVRARSRGRITRNPVAHDLYPARDGSGLVPEAGGLFDPGIFGPLEAPLADGFGHIELGFEVPHPVIGRPVSVIPVLPTALRPHDTQAGQDLTWAYAILYAHAHRTARLAELGAPEQVVAPERQRVRNALHTLLDNRLVQTPVRVGPTKRRLGSLVELLDPPHPDLARLERALFALGWVAEPT